MVYGHFLSISYCFCGNLIASSCDFYDIVYMCLQVSAHRESNHCLQRKDLDLPQAAVANLLKSTGRMSPADATLYVTTAY